MLLCVYRKGQDLSSSCLKLNGIFPSCLPELIRDMRLFCLWLARVPRSVHLLPSCLANLAVWQAGHGTHTWQWWKSWGSGHPGRKKPVTRHALSRSPDNGRTLSQTLPRGSWGGCRVTVILQTPRAPTLSATLGNFVAGARVPVWTGT